jgi:hypothetical protein
MRSCYNGLAKVLTDTALSHNFETKGVAGGLLVHVTLAKDARDRACAVPDRLEFVRIGGVRQGLSCPVEAQ